MIMKFILLKLYLIFVMHLGPMYFANIFWFFQISRYNCEIMFKLTKAL